MPGRIGRVFSLGSSSTAPILELVAVNDLSDNTFTLAYLFKYDSCAWCLPVKWDMMKRTSTGGRTIKAFARRTLRTRLGVSWGPSVAIECTGHFLTRTSQRAPEGWSSGGRSSARLRRIRHQERCAGVNEDWLEGN
ncbi:MAG: hypothetical protein IPP33_06105 [Flavobacteriales bacterium]|nr:hypothetical protein [Flavobacteriales bacterium]